jgi:hypothetical protein
MIASTLFEIFLEIGGCIFVACDYGTAYLGRVLVREDADGETCCVGGVGVDAYWTG